jgi:hypothetical protein
MPAQPKPPKGTASAYRRQRRVLVETRERNAKKAAKMRDRFRCRYCGASTLTTEIEAAHLRDKGMGGDGGRYSSDQRDYIALCREHHQGPRSLHSGHLRVVWGPALGDGDVYFVPVKNPGASVRRNGLHGD